MRETESIGSLIPADGVDLTPVIRVAIRFDDPSPTSDRALEGALVSALQRAGARATFAVIPFVGPPSAQLALDAERAAHLIEAQRCGVIEIAQHGYSHRNRAAMDEKRSEFRGLGSREQERMVAAGAAKLRELFGIDSVVGFVPPWNSFDIETLRALGPSGHVYLSAGVEHTTYGPDLPLLLPRTCQFEDLEAAIGRARRYRSWYPHVIAVLHHYDFVENGSGAARLSIAAFEHRLHWLGEQTDVRLMTLREMASSASAGLRHWPRRMRLARRLPEFLRNPLPRDCIVDAPLWRQLLRGPG